MHNADFVLGQASLPEACPVCAHEPVKAELCKPNKALRTTIKVFLRTEEKKRETQKGKDLVESAAKAPVMPVAVETPTPASAQGGEVEKRDVVEDNVHDESKKAGDTDHGHMASESGLESVEAHMDIPRPSVEVRTNIKSDPRYKVNV